MFWFIALAVLLVAAFLGYVLALSSTEEAGYQAPVRKAQPRSNPALFVPLEGEKGDFQRGTWVQ